MSYSLNSLKGLDRGLNRGLLIVGLTKGDTRSLDYSSYGNALGFRAQGCVGFRV